MSEAPGKPTALEGGLGERPAQPLGDGGMARRIPRHGWAGTPLGPVEAWPERLKALVELLLAHDVPMVVLWGPDLIQIYNDGYAGIMGGKHPAGLGQPTRACWPEVWHINAPIYARVSLGETLTFEDKLYLIARRGPLEEAWFTLTYSPLRDRAAAVAGVLVTVFETTGRHRAEASLRESEARFRAFVTATSDAVYRMSPDWTEMRELDGRGFISDTPGPTRGWMDVYIHPDDQAEVQAAIDGAIRSRSPFELEHRVRRIDGGLGWTLSRAVPILDEAGGIVEWLGAAKDVTARREAEAALRELNEVLERRVAARTAELTSAAETLRQSQKMEAVGRLTGGIAHDFNNMLQGVVGGVAMARRRIEAGRPDEAGRYLDTAREAAGRAAGLTQRLLAFARRQRLEPKLVDPDWLVVGMADLIRRTVGPGVAVEVELRNGAAGGSVLCDPNELESALLNLCINARDAMPEGGRLAIGTEDVRLSAHDVAGQEGAAPGGYVAISVSDTGQGMPPEVVERAFEPFFTTKPQGQGTGLGLSQVWGFARQSGGLVRIGSAPGQGTAVRILLPLHDAEAVGEMPAPPPAPPPLAPPGAAVRGTVLLVDDEDAVRGPAADRLRELGHVVLEARDGPEALRALASTSPDLLITDVGLPNGMNGRQVAEAARERVPGIPVLFITGYAGMSLPPGMEVVGKPFVLDDLARRAQALLDAGRRNPHGNPGT